MATDVFVALAQVHARGLGAGDVPILALRHPLGGIEEPAVLARAADAFGSLLALLNAPPDPLRD